MKHLAVATNEGLITVRAIKEGGDLNDILCQMKNAKEWIECMSYNPAGDRLAAGSHDNNIYIYEAK